MGITLTSGRVEVNKLDFVPSTEPNLLDNFKNQGLGTEIQFKSRMKMHTLFLALGMPKELSDCIFSIHACPNHKSSKGNMSINCVY